MSGWQVELETDDGTELQTLTLKLSSAAWRMLVPEEPINSEQLHKLVLPYCVHKI